MDDGGRCLLDVINDPQLLQSFLETSNNNNNGTQQQQANSDFTSSTSTSSNVVSTDSTTTTTTIVDSSSSLLSSTTTIIESQTQQLPPFSSSSSIPTVINQNFTNENESISTSFINTTTIPSTTTAIINQSTSAISIVATTSTIATTTATVQSLNNNGMINLSNNNIQPLTSQIMIKNNNPPILSTVTTTPTTTPKPIRARKSTATTTKSNQIGSKSSKSLANNIISSTPTTISSISGILNSSPVATSISSNTLVAATPTTFLNSTGLIPLTSLGANVTGGVQSLNFVGSQLTTNVANATSNVQSIRHTSTPTTAFVSAPQFQLGPRPMTVLPQPILLPGGLQLAHPSNGSNNPSPQQFVLTRPQHASSGPQLLQIIQTSQGPQLIAQTSAAPIQTLATSNNVQGIVQSQQQQTLLSSTTPAKGSKGSNKQILPKPNSGSSKNSKTTQNANTVNNSQNIKFIQTSTTTTPFSTTTNQGAPQLLISGGGGGSQTGGNQPQVIAGPNGTFFLSNNVVQTNAGSTQFSTQPQLLLQNQQLLAIRPTGPNSLTGTGTLLVNPNALTATNNSNNNNEQGALNHLAIPQSSSIINTSKSSNFNHILLNQNASTAPIVSQASGLTTLRQTGQTPAPNSLIIRPQIIGQPQPSPSPTTANNSTPQLIQIQTPNGPILLSVNLNSSSQTQQQSQPQIPQAQPRPQLPTAPPQTIQIGNTVFSLTTNPVSQQQPTINLGVNSGTATLSQTILNNQQLATHQNLPTQLHQQHPILSSSNNQKTNQTATKPKTQNPTKGLNLTDLLKETGILTDFSPPSSPAPTSQTKDISATVLVDPLNTPAMINTPSSQSQTVLMVSNPPNSNLFLAQQQQQRQQILQTNNKTPTSINSTTTTTATTLVSPLQTQTQQLRISLTPDGTLVLLSPNSNTILPQQNSGQQKNFNVQSNINNNKQQQQQQQQSSMNDSSGLGSSQPSPDSTTPCIDTASSPSVVTTTQTQSSTTQSIKNAHSIDICPTKSENTIEDSVVSSLSSTNISLNSSLKTTTQSSSIIPSTLTTCTADTSSMKPSQQSTNTSLVLSQPTTIPTFTTVLIPGTIMFLNDKRIPIATLNRTNQINELIQRLDNQIKQMIGQQQQKDVQQELQQLKQTILLIQSQPIIPNQIPQIKISDKVAQLLQISTWASQSTQIKTSPPTIALVNHKPITVASTTSTTMSMTSSTMASTTKNTVAPTTVKFVIGPNIDSNSIKLVHTIPNSSPVIQPTPPPPLLQPSSSSTTSLSTSIIPTISIAAIQSSVQQDTKTKTPPPVITSAPIVKQEKPKSNILKAIQSQLHVDQNAALHPDCRTPFRSRDDACKRLLRYHVFDQQQFSEKQIQKFDKLFEQASQRLLYKRNKLYDKFRFLIMKDSMKSSPSCEQVMINRMIIDEEIDSLKSDKELVASGGVLDLPPLPESWLDIQQQENNFNNNEEHEQKQQSSINTNELLDNVNNYFNNNNNNIESFKRKYEEDESTADFLLESTSNSNTNLFSNTSELNTDLNALCDIFDEESINTDQSVKNINTNDNFDENDVDKLIKLDTNNDTNFLEIDGLDDHNDDHNETLMRCNQNLDSTTTIDDDLEALYSNITDTNDLIGNNQNSLLWPNDSDNNNHHHLLNPTSNSMSSSNQNHFLSRSSSSAVSSTLSWTSRAYGNVNETEAAVAVQSIISGNDDDMPTEVHNSSNTMNFSGLSELSDSIHGVSATASATSNDHNSNDHLFQQNDNIKDNNSTIINDRNNLINDTNTSAVDLQINCAIKSIMNSDSYDNNELSFHHHSIQQQTSLMLPTSTSTNMITNHNHSFSSSMMMNSFSGTSTMSHINDPMLDEAVKSIL